MAGFSLGKIEKFIPYIAGFLAFNSVYSTKTNGWSQLAEDLKNLPGTITTKVQADYMKLVYAGAIFMIGIPGAKSLLKGMPPIVKTLIGAGLLYVALLEVAQFIDPPEYGVRISSPNTAVRARGAVAIGGSSNPYASAQAGYR